MGLRFEWLWVAVADWLLNWFIDLTWWLDVGLLGLGDREVGLLLWLLLRGLISKFDIFLLFERVRLWDSRPCRFLPLWLFKLPFDLFESTVSFLLHVKFQSSLQSFISYFLLKVFHFRSQLFLNCLLFLLQKLISRFLLPLDIFLIRCYPDQPLLQEVGLVHREFNRVGVIRVLHHRLLRCRCCESGPVFLNQLLWLLFDLLLDNQLTMLVS